MLDDKNSYNYQDRNLSDVFKELQEIKNNPQAQQAYSKQASKAKKVHSRTTNINKVKSSPSNFISMLKSKSEQNSRSVKTNDLKLSQIITGCGIVIVSMAILFPKDLSFKESYAKSDTQVAASYELNRHRLNMQSIISENAGMDRVKEQVVEDRDVEFETTYSDNASLPKGEEIVKQEGILGKDKVTAVKTYENGEFVEETILAKEKLSDPTAKIIDRGTSEFLAKHHVHIGDIMYFIDNANLKESADANSKDVAEIKKSIDVKLLELPNEEWCKVSFDGIEGYIKTSNLTSSYTTPNIVEKNRIQRILLYILLNITKKDIPEKLMREMRSTVILAGALIGRFKDASFSYPGGCDIGSRPIDLHLRSFEKLGINVVQNYGNIICDAEKIKGEKIDLDFPSVGATENAILASCLAERKNRNKQCCKRARNSRFTKLLK